MYDARRYRAPWAMLTIFITPSASVNPLATTNSKPPSVSPSRSRNAQSCTACSYRSIGCRGKRPSHATAASHRVSPLVRKEGFREHGQREDLLWREDQEFAHVVERLDHLRSDLSVLIHELDQIEVPDRHVVRV